MPDQEPHIGSLLDELSLGVVMLDPENLISLGELLEKLEKATEAFSGLGSDQALLILTGLRKAVEAIILERTADKNAALEVVGRGIGLLQELHRALAGGAVFGGDLHGLFTELKEKAGVELSAAAPTAVEKAAPVLEPVPSPPPEARPPAPGPSQYDAGQDKELFFGFITESTEHIETIEVNIITLEQDPENKETLNAVFRPFHTIKGVAGFLNLHYIHCLTHDVENLLDDARRDRLKVTPAVIDVVLDAVDILKKMINDVKASLETSRPLSADYGLDEFLDRIRKVQQGDVPEAEEPEEPYPYAGQKLGEILVRQGLISSQELERIIQTQEKYRLHKLGDLAVEKGIITAQDLEEALGLQQKDKAKKLGEILVETGRADPGAIAQTIRQQEEMRGKRLGEILILEKQAGAREVAGALREQRRTAEGAAMAPTVKVDTLKLDGLVDLVGELVIAQSLVSSNDNVARSKDQKLIRDLGHLSRITSELQRVAMGMRMVPIRQTFQKMIRLVRDLSHKSGKQVDLAMSGEDTEIDRNMVEAIYDPLVHMVRNSVDHGIEYPEDRKKKGKPAEGRIHLRSFHQGGNVVIEIEDDGQGLERTKILAKAVQQGLVGPEDELTDPQVYGLIFQPGFSTAEKVTDVSGRGVGMDVVRKAIDKLRGKIEVTSRPGQGSTITIRLPLTLAIIDGMIVRVGENRYILPTISIHESFRPGPGDYHTVRGQGEMIKVRDSLLPLIRLDRVMGTKGSALDPTQALVVVVENEGERRGLLVDEVLGKQEVVIKTLGERLTYVRSLAGGSILGDGRVGLILDVAGVFAVNDGLAGGLAGPAGGADSTGDWDMDDDWDMGPK
ncbi:MAG: chemotaxis protein CheA [Thermodesulfobacteriota bacterium]